MGDFLSPSGKIENSVLKYEKHVVDPGPLQPKRDIMRSVREAIDPGGAAQVYMEAAQIVTKGIREIAASLVDSGTPREYAVAQAYDIYRGAQKLTSVGKSLDYAEGDLRNGVVYTVPDTTFMRDFVSSVEEVGDDDILRLFGRILSGEIERPGSVSKHTMSILADMGKTEAETFDFLCSQCIGGRLGNGEFADPMPLMIEIEGMRRMTQKELDALNALGLTDVNLHGVTVATNHPFDADGVLVIPIGGIDYRVEKGDSTPYLSLSKFTRYGTELSSCCEVGGAPGFREAAISWLEGMDAKVMRIVKWNDDGSYDYEYDDER